MRTYTRINCTGKCNQPPDATINPHAWPRACSGGPPVRRPVPSHAWPVRPLRLPSTTWRQREARGIASRFGGLLSSRHGRDAAIWFLKKPAHSECCRTRRSQIPPCSRGKLRRPTHPKTADLHSFGDYYRGDGPRAGNGIRILFKNNGVGTAPQYRHALGRVARPGQAPQAGQTRRPDKTRRLGPND